MVSLLNFFFRRHSDGNIIVIPKPPPPAIMVMHIRLRGSYKGKVSFAEICQASSACCWYVATSYDAALRTAVFVLPHGHAVSSVGWLWITSLLLLHVDEAL